MHGVGGLIGVVMLGLFGSAAVNPAGFDGLFYGNPMFLFKQLVAVVVSSIWAFGFTYGMLWVINKFTPVRVSDSGEGEGLDFSEHGETAYEM